MSSNKNNQIMISSSPLLPLLCRILKNTKNDFVKENTYDFAQNLYLQETKTKKEEFELLDSSYQQNCVMNFFNVVEYEISDGRNTCSKILNFGCQALQSISYNNTQNKVVIADQDIIPTLAQISWDAGHLGFLLIYFLSYLLLKISCLKTLFSFLFCVC